MRFFDSTALSHVILAAGMVCAGSQQAWAQTAPAYSGEGQPAASAAGDQLGEQGAAASEDPNEILVTAQKRQERVQDIPLAVQVVTGQALEAQGIKQFSELTKIAPSLLVRPAEHPVNASVSMRGIGTFAFSPSVEPSVALQIDDVPVQFLARAFADLSDIERVEVLRGPQSTLYGRSASAGLLNIITRGPTAEWSGRVGGLVTTDEQYSVTGAISGPVASNLAIRVSGNFDRFDGNIRNLFTGDEINGYRTASVRGKLVWEPTPALTIAGQIGYIDGETTVGRPWIRLSPSARLRGNPAYSPAVFAPGVTVGEDNTDVVNNLTSGTEYTDFYQSARASLDLDFGTLVSITAWDHFELADNLDQDESAIAALDNRQQGTHDVHSFSQELRLVSSGTGPFRYTLGLFYSNMNLERDFSRGPFFSQARWFATNGTKQYAAFGQIEYELPTGTSLIAGLRYGQDKIDYTFLDIRNGNAQFAGNDSADYVTYKLGIQQDITPDVMVFFTHATGHKGQAYDLGTGFNLLRQQSGPVDEETSTDWQLGLKSQFLDRRVTMNVTLFNTTFDNFQAQGIETLADGTINFRLANVGELRTRGIELEGAVRPTGDLSFSGGVTYADAEILSFPFAQCYAGQTAAQGCTGTPARQDLAGFRPAQAPRWKLAVTGDYSPALSATLNGVLQASFNYQSRFNFNINNDPESVQEGYGILNLSAGVRDADRRWEVVGFVNNALDTQYFYNIANSRGNQGNVQAVQGYLPRDFRRYAGIRANFSF